MGKRVGVAFVAGAVVAVLVLTVTAAIAGTGIGGVFNLGQVNKVDRTTSLTGQSPRTLQITNTGTGASAVGIGINVPAGQPPLQVSSKTRVPRLNADMVDGVHASQLVQGSGSIVSAAADLPFDAGTNADVLVVPGFFRIQYECPASALDNGQVGIQNLTFENVDVFIDSGGTDPEYTVIQNGVETFRSATSLGDGFHVQFASLTRGVADISVFTVNRGGDCHVQAIATISSS